MNKVIGKGGFGHVCQQDGRSSETLVSCMKSDNSRVWCFGHVPVDSIYI